MKRLLLILIVITLTALFSSCAAPAEQATASTAPATTSAAETAVNVEREIRKLQQEYDNAALQQDAAAYERLFADDYIITQAGGKVNTKAEMIAMAKAGDVKIEVGRSDDVKVRLYGNTAIVTCRWTEKSTTKGKPFAGTQLFTTVWVKSNGRWQIVSDQGTLVAP
jgi:uncharacterized protein (TIGR02246 family)